MFDALLHRRERREAAERYREGLEWLQPESSAEEAASARAAAAERAGEYLTDLDRQDADEALERRLSIESAKHYGDELATMSLDEIVDGSWRRKVQDEAARWSTWLRPEHRADQHWQVAEAAMASALRQERVDDTTVAALDRFLAEIDPKGPQTTDDPWYERFATARLEAGLLPRARAEARLIAQGDETIALTEPGTVVEFVEEVDTTGRSHTRTQVMDVRIEASDQRIAVFGDQLLFATGWEHVVGVTTGEDDEHGPWVQLDDEAAHATHVVHSPKAELIATLARELHGRSAGA